MSIRKHSDARRVADAAVANEQSVVSIADDGGAFLRAGNVITARDRAVAANLTVELFPGQVSPSRLKSEHVCNEASTAIRRARIVLANDNRMFREALRTLIDAEPDLQVVGEAADGLEAVALTRQLNPDILLLDVSMPHGDGIDALRQLATSPSNTRIIVLTASADQPATATVLRLGAHGLVPKESGLALLLRALRGVKDGQFWVGREALSEVLKELRVIADTGRPIAAHPDFGLTARELQIIGAVVAASGNKDIAQQFKISEKTVKHHLTNIFDKLGVSNRLELALFALHHRLVAPTDH
jgi:DNA-binding NarL/FixJ family response regulator